MKEEKDLFGARIWKVDNNLIPRLVGETNFDGESVEELFDNFDLDLENNTYAIRIGKKGLK